MPSIQEIETWYGQPLYDSGGSKIGEISDSLLEGETGQPAWLAVATSGFGNKELSDDEVRQLYAHYALDFGVTPAGDAGDAAATTGPEAAPAAQIVPQQPFTQANMS